MAWTRLTADVEHGSNKVVISGSVPASQIQKGHEVLIGEESNMEVSYGTEIMYTSGGLAYSHLYLVNPYDGPTATSVEITIKPTGYNLSNAVSIFRNGSLQLNQMILLQRDFIESDTLITYQPVDENAPPIDIKSIVMIQAEAETILDGITDTAQALIMEKSKEITSSLDNALILANESISQSEINIGETIAASELRVTSLIDRSDMAFSDISDAISQIESKAASDLAKSESRTNSLINSKESYLSVLVSESESRTTEAIAQSESTLANRLESSEAQINEFVASAQAAMDGVAAGISVSSFENLVAHIKTQVILTKQSLTNLRVNEKLRLLGV